MLRTRRLRLSFGRILIHGCVSATGVCCNGLRPNDRRKLLHRLLCGGPLPEWMRPDKAGMILLPANFRWQENSVDVAIAVGERPKTKALKWLKSFCAARKRLLIYQMGEDWYAFGPPAFQQEMHDRIGRGERPWS